MRNAVAFEAELRWLSSIIDTRMNLYWGNESSYPDIYSVLPPHTVANSSVYESFIIEHGLSFEERLILVLALAPNMLPHLLDVFFIKNSTYDRNFTEFGGIKSQNHGGFIPTAETAAFILCGTDVGLRIKLFGIFNPEHFFFRDHVLELSEVQPEEPFLSCRLSVTTEYWSYFARGEKHAPEFNSRFPAKQVHTQMDWENLVLDETTADAIEEIRDWLKFGKTVLEDWGMEKSVKPGYRALFYGLPGTGKTLTATLLGKTAGLAVYRVDLSMIVSKYIGETEKNLAALFNKAEKANWILFFDEADALFGKRTLTSSANDRYANQEVSYLLQRIEDYPGVVILATNLKANMDDAFSRRFQSMIYFPVPGPQQRYKLWLQAIPKQVTLADDISLVDIAEKYELTGGAIINISLYILLKAVKREDLVITRMDLVNGIRKELAKDGKTVARV